MEREIPVKIKGTYVIEIIDFGQKGEGIGKVDNFTVFVDNVLIGDKVEIIIEKISKNFANGKVKKIVENSKFRVDYPCEISDVCGGCQIQNLDYKKQLEYKTKKVKDCIEKIGNLKDIKILDTIGMETPVNYRNKSQFQVCKKDLETNIGFYSVKSHDIVNVSSCCIQHNVSTDIIEIIRNFIKKYNISIYDEKTKKGVIRHILTKVGFATGEIMVCIVINDEKLQRSKDLVNLLVDFSENMLKDKNMAIKSIVLNRNTKKTKVILGQECKTLYGDDYITDYIGDIKFKISALSFFQVNPVQTKVLYDKALEYANLTGNETVWDVYCGIGSISLFLAQKAKQVYGVEIVKEAIDDAIENAEINNIKNIEFFIGEAEKVIPEKYEKENIKADVIVVDPPRNGCDKELLNTILKIQPNRIVYVSCDPATLSRDLKILTENNSYEVKEVQPVDMFPHTMHVETVVLIEKK